MATSNIFDSPTSDTEKAAASLAETIRRPEEASSLEPPTDAPITRFVSTSEINDFFCKQQ